MLYQGLIIDPKFKSLMNPNLQIKYFPKKTQLVFYIKYFPNIL